MNGYSCDDRCQWEERVLGQPGSLKKALTIPILVLLGGYVAYVQIDHPSSSREEPVESSATVLSDIAVPEPLWKEAVKPEASRDLKDFTSYREFLKKHQLSHGVLITRTCSEKGGLLFHSFPPLDDPNTFLQTIVLLPDLVSGCARTLSRQPAAPGSVLSPQCDLVPGRPPRVFSVSTPSRRSFRRKVSPVTRSARAVPAQATACHLP